MKHQRFPIFVPGISPILALRRSASGDSLRNAAASLRSNVMSLLMLNHQFINTLALPTQVGAGVHLGDLIILAKKDGRLAYVRFFEEIPFCRSTRRT